MKSGSANPVSRKKASGAARAGFTLIEIMIVVAIMGIIMGAGVPSLYKALHKEGLRKTVSDVLDVCNAARSRAILNGATTAVVFHPQQRTCEVEGGGTGSHLAHTAKIDDSTHIEMLDVNLREYKDFEMVKVRFFPNGTSDEMTLILLSDNNQWRKISVENMTGIASVDTDPNKWR